MAGVARRGNELHNYGDYLPSKLERRGVRGAPDWVVEVISASTARHDQVRKRRPHERAGVCEFWLVHPMDRVLTVYRLLDTEYGKPDTQALEGETPVGVLPGVVVRWDEVASWVCVVSSVHWAKVSLTIETGASRSKRLQSKRFPEQGTPRSKVLLGASYS